MSTSHNENKFNKDYYENGIKAGVSCYEKYRWLPESTILAAKAYISYLNIKDNDTVLDFGCAKGFYVKALRILNINTKGCDISNYAIENCDNEIKEYVKLCSLENPIPYDEKFDFIIAKDVLEHMNLDQVDNFLNVTKKHINKKMLIIVPLADNGKYRIQSDEMDVTHIIRFDKSEWERLFIENGWKISKSEYHIPDVKEKQYQENNKGTGVFVIHV